MYKYEYLGINIYLDRMLILFFNFLRVVFFFRSINLINWFKSTLINLSEEERIERASYFLNMNKDLFL